VNSINRLIDTVLNENLCGDHPQLIANNLNQELCECQLSSSAVFPLCHILFKDQRGGTVPVSQGRFEYNFLNTCDDTCANDISNYAESEF
jgi:hypothetical protein